MTTLLEFFNRYFDFIYLNPQYHITGSSSRGLPTSDASITVAGPILVWYLSNDRNQFELTVAPTASMTTDNWFWPSLVRQYLNNLDGAEYLSIDREIEWSRNNAGRIEGLFSNKSTIETVCTDLRKLRDNNSNSYWTQWRAEHGIT